MLEFYKVYAYLLELSSTLRAIDQFTLVAAPILTGLLMTYGSMFISAIVITGWNVISVFIEYSLLARVYDRVPDLAVKSNTSEDDDVKRPEELQEDIGKIDTNGQL